VSLSAPNFLLKIIPHVDGSARICELVEYYLENIVLKGAWAGPGALSLSPMLWHQWPNCRSWRSSRLCTYRFVPKRGACPFNEALTEFFRPHNRDTMSIDYVFATER